MSYFEIIQSDRSILRRLAGKVAELAARPVEEEKKNLWYRHNNLEATRPVIFCDPENGWKEIITEDQLECEGELARRWEWSLRKEIFWGESMKDDRVIMPDFCINYTFEDSGWGMKEIRTKGEGRGSYRWDAPLGDYRDMDKLHYPEITVDYETTAHVKNLAEEIFGGLLKVSIKGDWWWSLGMADALAALRGLEQILYDMYDYPDELHKLMAFLRDAYLYKLDFFERNGLLDLNNDGTYVGSGGFGWTRQLPSAGFDGAKVRTMDMWGFAEAQVTSEISPEMFEEFIFPYQLTILERFGLNCYGCCEPLDRRWHVVEKIPRLRRVSVSPWSNTAVMAEKLGDRYIYSLKPNPAHLAVSQLDEDFIRKELREAMRITRGCRLEVIMKDNHTLGGNPQNAVRWTRIAREEAERV